MDYMFYGAIAFNQDIGDWNVSEVKTMNGMFFGAIAFNQDIGEWNVSKVKTMNSMFYGATEFSQDITKWTMSGVQELSYMFYGAVKFNQSLCEWFNHIQDDSPYVVSVLIYSGCVFQMDPSFLSKEHFCQKCEQSEERRGE
jgi:surface protein